MEEEIKPKKKRFSRKWWLIGVIFFIILVITLAEDDNTTQTSSTTQSDNSFSVESTVSKQIENKENEQENFSIVTFVVDGDTVEIKNGNRIRLIGIDSPERGESFYNESRNALEDMVLNKKVRLEKDISDTDRYNRLLRYIFIDGVFINKEMVRQGYATAYPYEPDTTYKNEFSLVEKDAKLSKIGIWSQQSLKSIDDITQENTNQADNYTLPVCASSDCDCSHFSTHEYAQWFHNNHDPYDSHRLDRDNDGIACESLP